MLKIHLRLPGFTNSACQPTTKKKETIKGIRETDDSKYIYQNKVDKACSQRGIAFGDFNYLTKRTAADKLLCDKAFNIDKNPKHDG